MKEETCVLPGGTSYCKKSLIDVEFTVGLKKRNGKALNQVTKLHATGMPCVLCSTFHARIGCFPKEGAPI